jgi:hypothetical protein
MRMKALAQVVTELNVASRLTGRAVARRLRSEHTGANREFEHAQFRDALTGLLRSVPDGLVRGCFFVDLDATQPPWTDTGIELTPGDWVTTLAVGRTYLSRTFDIWAGAHFQLWMRVGLKGTIFRGTRDTHSFFAFESGRLHLASYLPGEWADQTGTLATPLDAYARVSGQLSVAVILWNGPTLKGLKKIAAHGDVQGLIGSEIDRIRTASEPPDGWRYHWMLGPAEAYGSCGDHGKANGICCTTREDVAVLQKDARIALTADTRLRWEWRVDQLPSNLREDTAVTHDYLGIAVEFDNGQDISYIWSAALPLETTFRCPLASWHVRQTHIVVQSGAKRLGQWLTEERNVFEDCARTMAGPPPRHIVRVWLVAVSLFQRQEGRAHFANITFVSADGELQVQ